MTDETENYTVERHAVTTSPEIGQLAAALAEAQGQITGAKKESENPFFKSKYADLAACWDACRGPLSDNGLSVIQMPSPAGNRVSIVTILAHSSGEWVRGTLEMMPKDGSPQAFGSCMTYARRYSLAAVVGLAQVDDDAESAQPRISAQKRTKYIKALRAAADKDDPTAVLEVWEELEKGEQEALWNDLRSDERAAIKKQIQAARESLNQPDPNYIDPEPIKGREVDSNREAVG